MPVPSAQYDEAGLARSDSFARWLTVIGPRYEKPSVADYGDLAGLTAGACPGAPQDASFEANRRFHVGEFS
jgi:hypothetical protein